MAYGIVHFFAAGTKEAGTTRHSRRYIPAESGCRKVRPSTRLAPLLVAGRSWWFTSPRRAGRHSAITP